jgi:(R,R)-butanediol dehydrogenase/meso-butanediol dehydrogenase/diacetyl reductase
VKALVLHAAGDARIEERPEPPAPGPGDVRLRVVRVGLCGTDASEYAAGPVMTPLEKRHPASGVQDEGPHRVLRFSMCTLMFSPVCRAAA